MPKEGQSLPAQDFLPRWAPNPREFTQSALRRGRVDLRTATEAPRCDRTDPSTPSRISAERLNDLLERTGPPLTTTRN